MRTARIPSALRNVTLAALLAAGACSEEQRNKPLDGGYPIDRNPVKPEEEADLAADPCRRRERGGWHYSIGHCREMLPPQRMEGVWVRGFEESSLFPAAKAMPHRNDPRRFRTDIEIDAERVNKLAGRKSFGPGPHAFALTLVARRTKYPYHIDCEGGRYYTFVAHEVLSARYLGRFEDPDPPPTPAPGPYKPFKRSGEGGVVAELEEKILAFCSERE